MNTQQLHTFRKTANQVAEDTPQTKYPEISCQKHNFLLDAASPFLELYIKLRTDVPRLDVSKFREQVINELHDFEQQLGRKGYPVELYTAASYCLSTAIDERVLSTSWGKQSVWSQQSLLNIVHQDSMGGEKFYLILDEMSQNVKKNCHLLELMYVLLNLGFLGKYYNSTKPIIDEISSDLYFLISAQRNIVCDKLSSRLIEKEHHASVRKQPLPVWLLVGLMAVMLILSAAFFEYKDIQVTEQIKDVAQNTKFNHIEKIIRIPSQ